MVYENVHLKCMVYGKWVFENVHLMYMVYENVPSE